MNKDIIDSHLGNPLIITMYIKQTKEYKKKEIKVAERNNQLIIPDSISPYQEEWSKKFKLIKCILIFGKCRSRKIQECIKKSKYAKIFGE